MNAIEAAEQAGIDLTLIEESLRLTPEERARQHQRALDMALQLEAAFGRSWDNVERLYKPMADGQRDAIVCALAQLEVRPEPGGRFSFERACCMWRSVGGGRGRRRSSLLWNGATVEVGMSALPAYLCGPDQ